MRRRIKLLGMLFYRSDVNGMDEMLDFLCVFSSVRGLGNFAWIGGE